MTIDDSFSGISTVINNRTYYLGQSFTSGLADPEVKKHSGNIIYVDNRPSITRSVNQKEDIKVIFAVLKNYASTNEPQRGSIL